MNDNGGVTLHYGSESIELSNRQGAYVARALSPTQRIPQRTRDGAQIALPLARLLHALGTGGGLIGEDLVVDMEASRLRSVRDGATTVAALRFHDLGAGREDPDGSEAAPADPVLSRLMAMHGVDRIVRVSPGVDLFWGGLEARQTSFGNAVPYHRLVGLPETMPAFLSRTGWDGARPCTAVSFGDAATYCCESGYAWLGVAAEIPVSVAARLEGRPATDLVGHEALEGWAIADPLDHDPDRGPNAFNLEWGP